MPIEIKMPALSPTMEEGTLAKWLVKAGDSVKSGDLMAEIETDKATMEFEAVDEGVIAEIVVPEGTDNVKVGAAIAILAGEGEDDAVAAKPAPKPEAAKPAAVKEEPKSAPAPSRAPAAAGYRVKASPLARRIAAEKGDDLGAVQGSGPNGRIVKADVEGAKPGPAPAVAAAPSEAAAAPSPAKPAAIPDIPHET